MIQAGAPALVLASQSTARASVLRSAGLRFEQRPAEIDEAAVKAAAQAEGAGADECALALAGLKAARHRAGREVWRHVARPTLQMRRFSDVFLDAYLEAEGDAVLSSVGAYRLEGPGIQLFDRIEGEHSAILGLPVLALLGFLRQHEVLTA